ncbi:MAG: HNH endonuclease [Actinobacteria bacterium]|nr:HNH endonuclease [Actinomycetota bacterium]
MLDVAHQRTAIEALGLRCSNRACNRTIALQIDHRVPYAEQPETRLDNQDPLCPDCHRRKTHHGWHLEPGTGPRRLLPPQPPDADWVGAPPSTPAPVERGGREGGLGDRATARGRGRGA